MKHIILFSGGKQSSYIAMMISKQYPKNTILLFHDTKTEPPDNYRFRKEICNYLGITMTEQSDGRDIWQVFDDNQFLGNNRVPLCSRILKIEQGEKFIKDIDDNYTLYYGFGIKEYRRAQKVFVRYPDRNIVFPLLENHITKDIIEKWLKSIRIHPPEMYKHFKHANCIPCVRGYKHHWATVFKHYPKQYQKASFYEDKFGYSIMTNLYLSDFQSSIIDNQIAFTDDTVLPCICAT